MILPAAAAVACGNRLKGARAIGNYTDTLYPEWTALPLAPYAMRKTLLSEVVPGQVWTLDQIFGTFYVHVPIRATVLAVDGGLLVYAPVAATPECVRFVEGLVTAHGPVRWIVLPSKAVEHKVLAQPFARRFPNARLFIAPGQFSVPVELPLWAQGFPDCEIIDASRPDELPWAGDCDTAALDIGTFGEVALYHRRSRTLLITDSLVAVPEDPPQLLLDPEYRKALAYHARDDGGELPDTAETRRRGWKRIALFATFFNPGALRDVEVAVPETSGDFFNPGRRVWQWQPGWEASFERLRDGGKPFVAPIIRELILKQEPDKARAYMERLTSWQFARVVPAHFQCPLDVGPSGLREAFGFLEGAAGADYCAEDLAFIADLQKSAIPDGRPVAASSSCGYGPRS